jgi:hypothetical protein
MLDDLVEQITARAQDDDEKMRAWHQAFEHHVAVPCDGFVIGEPISVVEFTCDGRVRRGLTATCRRQDGTTQVVSALVTSCCRHAARANATGMRTADGRGSSSTFPGPPMAPADATNTRPRSPTSISRATSNWLFSRSGRRLHGVNLSAPIARSAFS